MRGQAFGFQKNLVTVLVGKAVDLVFHAGAIARAHAFDLAHEHGAAVKSAADDVVGAGVGVRNPAGHLLRVHFHFAHKAEHRHVCSHTAGHTVAGLLQQLAEVDRTTVKPRRRAGLQAALGQIQFFEPCAQGNSRRVPCPAGSVVIQSHMDLAVQKRARRQHHGFGTELHAHLSHGTDHAVTRAG